MKLRQSAAAHPIRSPGRLHGVPVMRESRRGPSWTLLHWGQAEAQRPAASWVMWPVSQELRSPRLFGPRALGVPWVCTLHPVSDSGVFQTPDQLLLRARPPSGYDEKNEGMSGSGVGSLHELPGWENTPKSTSSPVSHRAPVQTTAWVKSTVFSDGRAGRLDPGASAVRLCLHRAGCTLGQLMRG